MVCWLSRVPPRWHALGEVEGRRFGDDGVTDLQLLLPNCRPWGKAQLLAGCRRAAGLGGTG